MSVFLCLVHTDGARIDEDVCRRYGAKREVPRVVPPSWRVMGEFAVMVGSDVPGLEPQIARYGGWLGVGLVRLDLHTASQDARRDPHECSTDLQRVLRVVDASGAAGVGGLVGDFSFVAWNGATRQLIAARDAFGVRRLYLAQRGGLLTFCTRASLLTQTEDYDLEYFAEFLLHGHDASGRTTFKDVAAMLSAEVVIYKNGTLQRQRYWRPPAQYAPEAKPGSTIVEEFKQHLFNAVRARLTGAGDVWAHLTGGMDSSSVVGVAQTLTCVGDVAHGVSGVLTYQAQPPLGGDVDHARLVAQRYGLRHEVLDEWRVWDDDGSPPPLLDQPAYEQANCAIERRMADTVAQNGGRILLTGLGADLYLRPQFDFAADMLARGHVRDAIVSVARWSVATRQSFWRLFARHGLYPLLPASVRYAFGQPDVRLPQWLSPDFSRHFGLRRRAGAVRTYSARWGAKSSSMLADALLTHATRVAHERIGEVNLEWRHPFFHRPLVEYGMRLPEEWRVAPGADLSKRVLRDAMRGILPEPVRLRRGKGGLQPVIYKALVRETNRFTAIAGKAVLAELGCLDPLRFAQSIARINPSQHGDAYFINSALMLELWLRQRSNRWT